MIHILLNRSHSEKDKSFREGGIQRVLQIVTAFQGMGYFPGDGVLSRGGVVIEQGCNAKFLFECS